MSRRTLVRSGVAGACLVLLSTTSVSIVSCRGDGAEAEDVAAADAAGTPLAEAGEAPSESRAWSGTGSADTAILHIRAPVWRVHWKAEETSPGLGVFHVVVFDEDDVYRTTVANILGAEEGTKEIEGPGRFYLSISGNQVAWEVEVEEVPAE